MRKRDNRENKNRATSAREDGVSSNRQSRKWDDTVFFTLLGSTSAKAVRRTLMKLTPCGLIKGNLHGMLI